MEPLKIFIGWDSREPVAFSVLAHSILTRATVPVLISPLTLTGLGDTYTRKRGATESTEFSISRFMVPYLSGYRGYSVFMDCDMLCRVDIAELQDIIYAGARKPLSAYDAERYLLDKSVLLCHHKYAPRETTKFLGQKQTAYPRKNWSSFIVFNNALCRALTPEYVNTASGLDLHRFNWLSDDRIGELPLEWNYLVGEDNQVGPPKFAHWTNGGPYFEQYANVPYADEWRAEFAAMTAPATVPSQVLV